ncbi:MULTISPECIES: group III truncated hemoglobin [unclassified Dysgonomonas]|uniref:group III truncated hemoglobin n=1 Tax=unclassified Dysgonomonas TaxID=2630389 RepID=UPI0013ED74CE|nr:MULTISPECIES: group III truncated hemoglobin [unclassified Dysgonomonas]
MEETGKKDIENREDVILLVNKFYQRVRQDDLIGPIFNEKIGKHWAEHLQKLYDFWESRLFDKDIYNGRPLMVHKSLPIYAEHFDRWLGLWYKTLDDLFIGAKTEEAKVKATNIGSFFLEKITEMRKDNLHPPFHLE